MKSSYYDLLDKYFGEFCGDGDAVDVVDERVMGWVLTSLGSRIECIAPFAIAPLPA